MTSPLKGGNLPLAMRLVFPDAVNIRTHHRVSTDIVMAGDKYQGRFDREGEVIAESSHNENVFVSVTAGGTLFSGSLRNWADAQGLVPFDQPFGEREAGLALDALGDAHQLPPHALREARLTMVEGTVDLSVPRLASDYVRACDDLSRTCAVRWDGTTAVFKTTEHETKIYDPPGKFRSKRQPVPDLYLAVEQADRHVLRFEHTLRSGGVPRRFQQHKNDEGLICAGLLTDNQFRSDLASLVLDRARDLCFGRIAVPERSGMTASERHRWETIQGIEAAGGFDSALDAVRAEHAADLITREQKKHRLRRYRDLYQDASITQPADLQAEFEAALDAVAQTYPI